MRKCFGALRRSTQVAIFFLLGSALLAGAAQAQGLTLSMQVGAALPVVVADNSPDDAAADLGVVAYLGPVGGFQVSVISGVSKPVTGTAAQPEMDLFASVLGGPNQLFTIKLTDTDFPGAFNGIGNLTSAIGGNQKGTTTTFQTYLDSSNTPFGISGPTVCTTGAQPATGTPFTSNAVSACPVNGLFSMTLVAAAVLGGSDELTFDYNVTYDVPQCGAIGDYVWHDLNHDGLQDPNEPGINGVTLLLKKNGTTLATTVTAPHMGKNGYYLFQGVCAGDYTVEVDASTVPAGFTPTTKDAGADDTIDNDSDGGPVFVTQPLDTTINLTIDFGFETQCTGTIGDFVWHDLNHDGIQDPGEPGIDGISVHLVEGNQTTVTGPNGYYQFGGLCAGTYTVEILVPPVGMTAQPGPPGPRHRRQQHEPDVHDPGRRQRV